SPPISAAARITLVPADTVTSRPSIVSVTCSSDWTSGVPKSFWRSNPIVLLHTGQIGRTIDISRFRCGFHSRCADCTGECQHGMLSIPFKDRFDGRGGTGRPVADHRLAFQVTRGRREYLEQIFGQVYRVDP